MRKVLLIIILLFRVTFPQLTKIRLSNGRTANEGIVEINSGENNSWDVVCGDGWSLLEANVVCKTLGIGYANGAFQTNYFGGNLSENSYSSVKCIGNENSFYECQHDEFLKGS